MAAFSKVANQDLDAISGAGPNLNHVIGPVFDAQYDDSYPVFCQHLGELILLLNYI